MTTVIRPGEGHVMSLPGRTATELVSAAEGGYDVTVRRVVIPPERDAQGARGPHTHPGYTEVIYVLSGAGEFTAGDAAWPAGPGDLMVVSPGQPHRTRNTGGDDLVLLCFFPVPDISAVEEPR